MGNVLRSLARRRLRTGQQGPSQDTAEVIVLLHRFNREHGQTIVLVAYDPRVSEACSRVLTMDDGLAGGAESDL